uniref:Protein SCO1, mitochondrial n=1 Tax=Aceria tosichella TaxID=561515 RepID=A0A6G1SLE6_9ACAR
MSLKVARSTLIWSRLVTRMTSPHVTRFNAIRAQSSETGGKTSNSSETPSANGEPSNKEHANNSAKKISKANIPPSQGGPITWRSLLIGGGTLALLTGYFLYLKRLKQEKIEREKTRTYGKAAIGGSFELVDTTGKLRNSDEFRGNWLLIYFGFTHCPDVCPEELDKLATVVNRLTKDNYKVLPLFISVDPERDTPEMVGKYLSEFSDKFIGLTGTKEQVEKATRAHRVYYSVGPKDEENDYIVDHTIISYLIDPKGELVDYFGQTKQAEEMEATIKLHMAKYKANG